MVDCDERGLLSLDELSRLPASEYDGIVLTNPFGLCRDVDRYTVFAEENGKVLIVDNAAGVRSDILPVAYQSLSLHHTKPYGVGEGGLVLLPAAAADELYQLLDYGTLPSGRAGSWLNNGKISEVACAFHLDRLERAPEWVPFYEMQARRIFHVCESAGLRLLLPVDHRTVATSAPFVAHEPVPEAAHRQRPLDAGQVLPAACPDAGGLPALRPHDQRAVPPGRRPHRYRGVGCDAEAGNEQFDFAGRGQTCCAILCSKVSMSAKESPDRLLRDEEAKGTRQRSFHVIERDGSLRIADASLTEAECRL